VVYLIPEVAALKWSLTLLDNDDIIELWSLFWYMHCRYCCTYCGIRYGYTPVLLALTEGGMVLSGEGLWVLRLSSS